MLVETGGAMLVETGGAMLVATGGATLGDAGGATLDDAGTDTETAVGTDAGTATACASAVCAHRTREPAIRARETVARTAVGRSMPKILRGMAPYSGGGEGKRRIEPIRAAQNRQAPGRTGHDDPAAAALGEFGQQREARAIQRRHAFE